VPGPRQRRHVSTSHRVSLGQPIGYRWFPSFRGDAGSYSFIAHQGPEAVRLAMDQGVESRGGGWNGGIKASNAGGHGTPGWERRLGNRLQDLVRGGRWNGRTPVGTGPTPMFCSRVPSPAMRTHPAACFIRRRDRPRIHRINDRGAGRRDSRSQISHAESEQRKWQYVCLNPVRYGWSHARSNGRSARDFYMHPTVRV